MKVMAINGSPRRNWNTAQLLESALEGAASAGAETEFVHLYDLDFKGCKGCMSCKLRDCADPGRCVRDDGLTPVLDGIREADALVLGSPIYFGDVTGEMRCLMERLFFPLLDYENPANSYGSPKRTALVYTMNVSEKQADEIGYRAMFRRDAGLMGKFFGDCDVLVSTETQQVKDYSRYRLSNFDAEDRYRRHDTVFRDDLRRAYELGVSLVRRPSRASSR